MFTGVNTRAREINLSKTYGKNNPGLPGGSGSGASSSSGIGYKGANWQIEAAKELVEDLNSSRTTQKQVVKQREDLKKLIKNETDPTQKKWYEKRLAIFATVENNWVENGGRWAPKK